MYDFRWVIRVAGAHGLKATCYLWDQWEDSLLATLARPMYPLILIVTIMYVMYMWWINWK